MQKYQQKYRSGAAHGDQIHLLMTDLVGVRIVCLYEDDIVKVAEKVKSAFEVTEVTDRMKLSAQGVDRFAYRALHYDLLLGRPREALVEYKQIARFPVELQLRTIFQDAWSVIDHQLKYKKSIELSLARRVNVFAALCELADQEFVRIRDEIRALPSGEFSDVGSDGVSVALNLRGFLDVLREYFPSDSVLPEQADSLLAKVRRYCTNITLDRAANIFRVWSPKLEQAYNAFTLKGGRKFSPLTRARVILALGDHERFSSLVTSTELRQLLSDAKGLGTSR